MGKVPTLAIVAAVIVLIIGMSVAVFYFLIKPKKEELTKLRADLAAEQEVVAQRPQAEKDKAAVQVAWMKAQQDLANLREKKSPHISLYMPLLAMTAMWYEYRDDLPKAVESYFVSQGVTIQSGAAIPAPPLTPPTVPATGFMQVPSGSPLNLTIKGSLAQLQKVYENLSQMRRIATIGALTLSGTGPELTATIPLSLYILVEGAEAVAPPPAPAGGGPEGAMPPGMEGKGEPGKGEPAPPSGPAAKGKDKSEDTESAKPSKPGKGDGGGGGDE
jgi:hypothetical protein